MSTDRPKRNIIKKNHDISDGMPWCEERLVRKVLFLSLREFRDTHRATHKHSVKHTQRHKCTSKNTLLHASQKAQALPNVRKQKKTRTTQRVHATQRITDRQPNTHAKKNMHISTRIHCQKPTNKEQKINLSQDSHTSINKCAQTHNVQRQLKMCTGKNSHSVHNTQLHVQENAHTFHKSTISTRILRSHKSQQLNKNRTESKTHTQNTPQNFIKNCTTDNTQTLLSTPVPARILRSRTPTSLSGSLVNRSSRCQSFMPSSPSWSWSLQTRHQRRPASFHRKDDPANKRPRLQAQRKFAQSPPSSPGPAVSMTSAQSNHSQYLAAVSCLTRRRPKTEDFLSFLCLRGSAALPSNMAFLASGGEKDPSDRHLTSCLSTNHRPAAEGRNMTMFSRTTVELDSMFLRGRPEVPFCPLMARAHRRRERERREEEQYSRRQGTREPRRERVNSNFLRPRQLSLQVAKVTGFSQQTTPRVSSFSPLKPTTGIASRRPLRPHTRPTSTCKLKGLPQSRHQETNNKYLSRHNNYQMPHNLHLSNHHSNIQTFSSLQNSGRNAPAQITLTNNSVIRQLSENHGVLRFSRRRRGLPPDTSPTSLNIFPRDNHSSKNYRTLQNSNEDVLLESCGCICEMPQPSCDKVVREEPVSHMDNTTSSLVDRCGYVEDMRLESVNCNNEKLQDKVTDEKLSLVNITALEPSQEGANLTSAMTDYDLTPVNGVICGQVREKRLQTSQPTIPKPVTRTTNSRTVSRGATARTNLNKDTINSVTSTCARIDTPASFSAKQMAKGTNTSTSKYITKCTSLTSSYTISINSQGAGKDSSKGVPEDLTKDCTPVSSYSSTSKGSKKGFTQTKCSTSSIKTRTSPRILLKH